MTAISYELVLGETRVVEDIVLVRIVPAGPAGEGIDSAEIQIRNSALLQVIADYQAEVRLFRTSRNQQELVFTGIIDAAIPDGDLTTIRLITGLQLLAEVGTGGLGIDDGAASINLIWSLLRHWGIEAEKMDLDGFEPGPSEMCEVATSLDGIELSTNLELGGVLLLPPGLWSQLANGLGPEELRETYSEAKSWALSLVQAQTWFSRG
ncbi:MAG: hypothetical protein U0075_01635 [Thermomicrobiales bacterium]